MGDLKKNIVIFIASDGVAKAILLLSTPLITRLYTPELYGVATVILSLIGIIGGISSLRYDRAVVLSHQYDKAMLLVHLSFAICLFISFTVLLLVLALGSQINEILKIPEEYYNILYLLPVGVFFMGAYNILSSWVQWQKKFKSLGLATVSDSFIGAISKIGLTLFINVNPVFLVLGSIAGSISASVIALKNFKLQIVSTIKKRNRVFVMAKRYRDFPLYNMPVVFISRANQSLPLILLPILFSPQVAGLYAIAYMALNMPVTLFSNSLRKVLLKEMADRKNTVQEFDQLIVKSTVYLALFGILPFGILFFWSVDIFTLVFGGEWSEAGKYARFMIPWLFLMFVDSAIMNLYVLHRVQKQLMKLQIVMFFIKVSVLLLAYMIFANVEATLMCYLGVSFLVHLYLMLNALKINIRYKNAPSNRC